jgi:hypothetical protein
MAEEEKREAFAVILLANVSRDDEAKLRHVHSHSTFTSSAPRG